MKNKYLAWIFEEEEKKGGYVPHEVMFLKLSSILHNYEKKIQCPNTDKSPVITGKLTDNGRQVMIKAHGLKFTTRIFLDNVLQVKEEL